MKKITSLCTALLLPFFAFSQTPGFWNEYSLKIPKAQILESLTQVSKSQTLILDLNGFKKHVLQAPFRGNGVSSSVFVDMPDEEGKMKTFRLFQAHTMSPGLAAKFPSISSFVGVSKDKKDILRLTLTDQGVYGMVLGEDYLILNPLTASGTIYQVFNTKNASRETGLMQCLYKNPPGLVQAQGNQAMVFTNDGKLRTYDLALACTGEYSQYHIAAAGLGGGTTAQQKAAVMAAMVVTMDRVNGVYEKDLAITMSMVANNDQLIYLNGATDPYTNNNGFAMLGENQTNIDAVIGNANYDIGHVFSTAGGGVAATPSVCNTNAKAQGVTGQPAPVGDFFDIDFVAHEMGHQFGANHTQNNACQRNNATAVEPGSGSTIMGYAGICAPNVQAHSDAYFHTVNLDEIISNLNFGLTGTCPTETIIANTEPSITAIPDYTIPYGTAFVLTGNATDPEGDAMTYCWEQTDNQVASMPPSSTSTQGPAFRSLDPSASPSRYFPEINSILAGNLAPTWEVVPNVARTLNFTLTVRDNNVLGGQTATDDIVVSVANTGPFTMTSQNTAGLQFDQNEAVSLTWNVAGTTANGINAANVDILLSYDGGQTYPAILANTANDGSEAVNIPIGTFSTTCRLMIKASNNIFFDVNNENFEITNQVFTISYVYQNGSWTPSDPSGAATPADNITIINGMTNITADTQLNDLTINAGATLNIEQALSPSGNIVNNGSLVFVNNATMLGQLGDMTGSTISGSGTATVQRFIPARPDTKAAYRYITSAVNTTTSINANWQEGATSISQDPNPGFGMFITGSTTGANGFDQTIAGAVSMFELISATKTFVGIPNTDVDVLQAGNAYAAYVWGDRSVDIINNNEPVATNTTLQATGTLVVGNKTFSLNPVSLSYNFIGNPYQAIVDMDDVLANSTNLNTAFLYVWEPGLSTQGAYALVILNGGSTIPASSKADEFLQPGQGVMVLTANNQPTSILFEESDKDVSQTPTDVFKPQNTAFIELQLFQADRFANGQSLSDALRVSFSAGESNAVMPNDAPKLWNFDETIALVNGNQYLIFENRALPTGGEILQLHSDQYRVSDYTFKALVNGLPANVTAYLNDAYLGTQAKLANGQETLVAFSVDAGIPASIAPNRFSIGFEVNSLSVDEVLATGFELYPNPAENGGFFIAAPGISGETQIAMYNLLGQKVLNIVGEMGSDGRIRVETHNLEAGVYLVEVVNDGKTFVDKLIIR